MERVIIITAPGEVNGEADIWQSLWQVAPFRLHLRKPGWKKEKLRLLMKQVPVHLRHNITVHYQPEVAMETGAGGIHLPFSQKDFSSWKKSKFSCSLHRWQEAEDMDHGFDYAFISPVFDSLSKTGYWKNKELEKVPDHLRARKIFALGGLTDENIAQLPANGFYGAAFLGFIWQEPSKAVGQFQKILSKQVFS